MVDLAWIFPTNQLGDHFSPVMYLLSIIYLFTTSYEPLLILGNVFVVLSGFVLYLISETKLKNRLLSVTIIVAFTLFIGLQNAIIAGYHNDLFGMLTLSLTLLFILKKQWALYWLFFVLTLGLKENFTAIGIGLGIYLFFKEQQKKGVITIIFSIIWYILATKFVMPAIANYPYAYSAPNLNLEQIIKNVFYPTIKIQTILVSFLTFGLLPLLSGPFFPTIFQDFFTRFVLNTGSARWDLGMHYNTILSVLLAFGSIEGAEWLLKKKIYKKVIYFHILVIFLLVSIFHRFVFHGPLGLLANKDFYKHTNEMNFLRDFIKLAPKTGIVMAPNNLGAYLTHGPQVMLLNGNYEKWSPDAILIDTRPGQSPNNFWPANFEGVKLMEKKLDKDANYRKVKVIENQAIYFREENSRP